jgi:hypothetical protein
VKTLGDSSDNTKKNCSITIDGVSDFVQRRITLILSYVTTDVQSANLLTCQVPILGPKQDFCYS